MEQSTDEALLLSGDLEDFGRFYDRYVRPLLAFHHRRTGDPEAAADLTRRDLRRGDDRPHALPGADGDRRRVAVRDRPAQAPNGLDGSLGAQIADDMTPQAARQLASVLTTGPLPATLSGPE